MEAQRPSPSSILFALVISNHSPSRVRHRVLVFGDRVRGSSSNGWRLTIPADVRGSLALLDRDTRRCRLDVLIGWPGGDWQATARLAATLVGGYLFILWVTSVLWVYRDIQQRTHDPVSQLISVAISIVFPMVSLPIYTALRPTETLHDAYLRLLEREVLLAELWTMQGGGEPRLTTSPTAVAAPAVLPASPASSLARAARPIPGASVGREVRGEPNVGGDAGEAGDRRIGDR